jgi:RNA polymerase sigma factor (sigma-70 family)
MAGNTMSGVVRHLRRAVLRRDADGLSDGQLLECFVADRDGAAFAALVRRHGPMVLGVCRRVLRHRHDAEDAFQATFLVLAKKAGSVRPRELVGHWLYGVARRTALKARTAAARRQARERRMGELCTSPLRGEADHRFELEALLDDAVQGLPERYRVPLVLCELEGKSRRQVARQMGVPEGTVSSRLARARHLLARRLTARGLSLSAGAVGAILTQQTATATVPAALVASTVRVALGQASTTAPVAALTEGVIRAMLIAKWKLTAFVLAAALAAGLGAGAFSHRALADKPKPTAKPAAPVAPQKGAAAAADKPKAAAGPSIPAAVVSVDADKHTITVSVSSFSEGKKEQVEKTFELAREAKVVLVSGLLTKETKEGKLADLTADTPVTLQLSADRKTVRSVAVHGGSLYGSVKAVDADKNTVTIAGKDKGGPFEKTLELARGAKVWLDDGLVKNGAKEGKLADLAEGTPVVVHLSGYDRKTVVRVDAHGPGLYGSLKGVDAGANTITITVKEDGNLVDKTFDLAKNVKVDGGKLGELTEGTAVSLQLSIFDKKTVVHVHVHKE